MTANERFVAIDFETATGAMYSACSVGIVTVEGQEIVEEFTTLIQPPDNEYWYWNTKIHGINAKMTKDSSNFLELSEEILSRLQNQIIVAHNSRFDLQVLRKTMAFYGMNMDKYNISSHWECTLRIYQAKGFKPANLKACCDRMGINLNHHEALSDARGSALLYAYR